SDAAPHPRKPTQARNHAAIAAPRRQRERTLDRIPSSYSCFYELRHAIAHAPQGSSSAERSERVAVRTRSLGPRPAGPPRPTSCDLLHEIVDPFRRHQRARLPPPGRGAPSLAIDSSNRGGVAPGSCPFRLAQGGGERRGRMRIAIIGGGIGGM